MKNPDAGGMSPRAYKKRKSGPAAYNYDYLGKRTEVYDPSVGGTYEYFNGATRDSYKGGTHWSIDGGVFTYEVGSYDYGVYFSCSDHLGTPKITTNTSGTVIKTESMGPFGDGFTATGASISDIGFAGGDYDRSGDSNNFGARDYKPIEGRWLSPDPAGLAAVDPSNPQTWNRYAYVLNNPVSFTDPSGLFCVWDNGSYDSNDDPVTGSQAACQGDGNGNNGGGGTWFNGSPSDWSPGASDWSGEASGTFAGWAQGINPSVGDFGDPSGVPDASAFGTFTLVSTTTSSLPGQIPNAATPNSLPQCAPTTAAGSVVYKAGVPPASPAINNFMLCVSGCMGGNPFRATSTSDSHPPGDPHSRGLAVDGTIPGMPGQIMQCGANCGALFQQNEFQNPSPNATGGHFHFQLVPGRGGALGPVTPTCHY